MSIPIRLFPLVLPLLLLCSACGSKNISMPGEKPVYTVTCDNKPEDCHAGAQSLCGGPYTPETRSTWAKQRAADSFGWVEPNGEQAEIGSGGGRYSIRIRCE